MLKLILSLFAILIASSPATASPEFNKVYGAICYGKGVLDNQLADEFISMSEAISNGQHALELPDDCADNLYVDIYKFVDGQISEENFAKSVTDNYGPARSSYLLGQTSQDFYIQFYLRVACGANIGCVKRMLKQWPFIIPHKSAIYCDFSDEALDPELVALAEKDTFQAFPFVCTRLTENRQTTSHANQTIWFDNFKKFRGVR